MRWGLGPVFFYECLTNSRRWQTYALRSIGVTALLVAMITIAISPRAEFHGSSWRGYAQLGEYYFYAMIGVELALVMLAAPAAAAGAICLDRAQGTLAHMLMTDLSDAEIVLGKLAARLMPVLGLVACSWPVMAISSLLGGIDPIALILAFAIIVAMALLGCTIALTLSVWSRKTHEVIISTYTVWILAGLIWPIWYGLSTGGLVGPPPPWTLLANPFYVAFAPYAQPAKLVSSDYAGFFGVTLGSSAILSLLAVWRTRPVACRGSGDRSRRPQLGLIGRLTRWLPGPSLDRNPVLWREWHRSRPTPWMMVLLTLLMGTTGALCIAGAVAFWRNGAIPDPGRIWKAAGVLSYFLHIMFGLLILSAVAPTSMAEERQRGSLDILSATALSTRSIVIGKWLGTFRLAVPMTACPGLLALAMATARSGPFVPYATMHPEYNTPIALGARIHGVGVVIATILAHGALVTSIGIALAVWIKRQSRAIAISVGLFVFVNAVWPLIAQMIVHNPSFFGRDLGGLSPAMLCGSLVSFFTNRRYGFVGEIVWCGTFWAVEVFILAMGLLWLTVRTFDDCFDRIPDQPRRLAVYTIVTINVSSMIGGASLVWAIDVWVEGVRRGQGYPPDGLILAYSLAIAIGLVLIATVSATSISARHRRGAIAHVEARNFPTANGFVLRDAVLSLDDWDSMGYARATIGPGRFVLSRWCKSFRLVLLVAIGPALLAIALTTAREAPRYHAESTKDGRGRPATTWVLDDPNVPYISYLPLGDRLAGAALLVVTILVHGAAGVSAGLAFATSIRWTRFTIGAVFSMTLFVVFLVPTFLHTLNLRRFVDFTLWSVVVAAYSLLDPLLMRSSFHMLDFIWSVLFWDVVVGLFSAGLLWLAIRTRRRRALSLADGNAALGLTGDAESFDVESALIGD